MKVYRFWEFNGTAYMAMPFYEGPTLSDVLATMGTPPGEEWLGSVIGSLLDALELIHSNSCFHRDIAPDNILLVGVHQKPLLLDFGAARKVIGDATQALTVILKSGYAPVEQYAEDGSMKQGAWMDVYAVCAVMYRAITGRPPPPSISRLVEDNMAPASSIANGKYSATFLAAVDHGLAVRPEHRTQSASALRAEMFCHEKTVVDDDATVIGSSRVGKETANGEREVAWMPHQGGPTQCHAAGAWEEANCIAEPRGFCLNLPRSADKSFTLGAFLMRSIDHRRVRYGWKLAVPGCLSLALMSWPVAAPAFDLLDTVRRALPPDLIPGAQPQQPSRRNAQQPVDSSGDGVAGFIGRLGHDLCNTQARNTKMGDMRGLCATSTQVVAEMTRQLGAQIADGMRESEQREVLAAAATSIKTGEPSVVDLPESGGSVQVAPSKTAETRHLEVELLIDGSLVRKVPLMKVIGQAYDVRSNQKLLGEPAAKGGGSGGASLRAGETVHAIGQVEGGNMVLVSRWIKTDDGTPMPTGTGYVSAAALAPSQKSFPTEADVQAKSPQAKSVTVTALLECRSTKFKRRDTAGNTVEATSYLCVGPDGSTRSA